MTRHRHRRPNPRPIPQERAAVAQLVENVIRHLATVGAALGAAGYEPLGWHTELFVDSVRVRDVAGREHTVLVRYVADDHGREAPDVLGAGFGFLRAPGRPFDGRPVIQVALNGARSLRGLASSLRDHRDELASTLAHEITHAAEYDHRRLPAYAARPGAPPPNLDDPGAARGYFNDPTEVRAHMRQFAEVLRPRILRRWAEPRVIVDNFFAGNAQWLAMEPHLSPKNRARIVRGVVRVLSDEGLL